MGNRFRWVTAGAIAAAAVIGGGALAGGSIVFGDAAELHGCAQKENGQLRLSIDGTCRSSEVAVSWNKQGPQGPVGPAGQAGVSSVDDLAGTSCTLHGRTGVLYLAKGDSADSFQVFTTCMMADGAEPNDTPAAAAALRVGGMVFRTIFPAGDEDWFSLPHQALSYLSVGVDGGIASPGVPVTGELYRDGVLVKTLVPGTFGSWGLTWSSWSDAPGDTSAHDWVVHMTSSGVQLYNISISGA